MGQYHGPRRAKAFKDRRVGRHGGVFQLERELERLLEERLRHDVPPAVGGPLGQLILRELSRRLKPTVAYLGPEGSFTWEAASLMMPGGRLTAARSIGEVVRAVASGEADYGVVPFINSLEGPVGETVDALAQGGAHIVAMGEMRIVLCLARKGIPRVLYTHPHAAGQAKRAIAALGIPVAYASSTAEAVREFQRCSDCAVLASPRALEGLQAECGVEDGESYTRFALLSRGPPAGGSRVALIFAVPNVPGALYRALRPIATRNINMTLIYSRPTRLSPWDYFFLVELEHGRGLEEALEDLAAVTTMLRVVGSYHVMPLRWDY